MKPKIITIEQIKRKLQRTDLYIFCKPKDNPKNLKDIDYLFLDFIRRLDPIQRGKKTLFEKFSLFKGYSTYRKSLDRLIEGGFLYQNSRGYITPISINTDYSEYYSDDNYEIINVPFYLFELCKKEQLSFSYLLRLARIDGYERNGKSYFESQRTYAKKLTGNNNKKGYSLMRIKQIDNELINLGYLEETDTGEIVLSKKYWKDCYDAFEQKKTDTSDTIYKSRYVKRDLKQLPPQEIEVLREREFLKTKKKRKKRKKRVSRKKYRLRSYQNRKSA